jgi:predicted ATPase
VCAASFVERLDGLPAATCELLAIAAVLGHEFEATVLESVAELPPGTVADRLAPAVDAGLLRAAGASRYAFCRALVRETLYEDLPFPRRVELHRRAGGALLRGNQTENVDELAITFCRAPPVATSSWPSPGRCAPATGR